MGERRVIRWPWVRRAEHVPATTLPEAEAAIRKSRAERARAARMRPQIERATSALQHEREVNHLAERFRGALRGGAHT